VVGPRSLSFVSGARRNVRLWPRAEVARRLSGWHAAKVGIRPVADITKRERRRRVAMKTASKFFLSCLVVFALCGFSSRFDIKVSQQDHDAPSFELSRTNLIHASNNVEINTFIVVGQDEAGRWDYKHPQWAFGLPPGSGKSLSKISYGQVPPGCSETTKASKLIAGVSYLAVGLGLGADGSAKFTTE
jgi:hypothetical protein